MGRQTTMSVLGLYNWDHTLFDLMELPEGIEKDVVVGNILQETAELEVLYPDPNFMKQSIGLWSKKELEVWQHLYDTTKYDYDPIENYNRKEEGDRTSQDHNAHGGSDSRTGNNNHQASGDSEAYEAGYDSIASASSDGLVKTERRHASSTASTQDRDTTEYGQTIDSEGRTDYHIHAHGNIGVTTTQKLISEERNIAKMNLYDIIITEFRDHFCVMVW